MNFFLPYKKLNTLFHALRTDGYKTIGPSVKDHVIHYQEIQNHEDLPWGYQDHQTPGSYQLKKTNKNEAFLFSNGPEAVKPIYFKKEETLWKVIRDEKGALTFKEVEPPVQKIALFGIRPCDLKALMIQDKVFNKKPHKERHYLKRREQTLIIVVNCGYAGNNCFCVSAGSGPKADDGYDISLTEIENGFIWHGQNDVAKKLVAKLALKEATKLQQEQGDAKIHQAKKQQKKLPLNNSQALAHELIEQFDNPHWQDIASRCLSCGNCTQVCPTCFCYQTEEKTKTDDMASTHTRLWDSCFNIGHSYMNHTVVRFEIMQRYRQWLIHKLSTWWAQFGSSGCVGCGRCISWCPVGIDITEEVKALCQ